MLKQMIKDVPIRSEVSRLETEINKLREEIVRLSNAGTLIGKPFRTMELVSKGGNTVAFEFSIYEEFSPTSFMEWRDQFGTLILDLTTGGVLRKGGSAATEYLYEGGTFSTVTFSSEVTFNGGIDLGTRGRFDSNVADANAASNFLFQPTTAFTSGTDRFIFLIKDQAVNVKFVVQSDGSIGVNASGVSGGLITASGTSTFALGINFVPNVNSGGTTQLGVFYANGIVIKEIRHKLFNRWTEPPVSRGGALTHTFNSELDFQLSTDGGVHFTAARAAATMRVGITNSRAFMGRTTYQTEVTLLDVPGGDLPSGVRIRESPTRVSRGGTSSLSGGGGGGAGGGAAISSFFDIFTEVSTDGGTTWGAATNGPAHMELRHISPAYLFTNNLLPVLVGEYISLQQWHA